MCGIVGIVEQDPGRPVAPADLERMVRMLHHRGPDEEGSITLPGVGLGMRRLAIVDLATGQQPILNEAGDIKVVANGEIYNFHELQRELESHGHRFRSRHSDIEVLVHAYEQWGESFLERLRGMFALALWDGRTRTLIAARDRAGEKPLYWTQTPRGLLLASEVKALLVRPEVSRELDPIALDQFLTYEYVLAPRTMLQGVHKLPPAHFLRYRGGQATVHRYWDAADVPVKEWKDEDAAEALRAALGKAVERQLMADVPLGAFLSGGIDSSSIVALMSEASSQPVNSFSIGFADGTYNELPYAREVAALFKTNHRERTASPDLGEMFERLVVHLDEPFADVSLFPTFSVSELAREHVKVVLSGDGGDELFGGYDAYEAQALVREAWLDGRRADAGPGRRGLGVTAHREEEGPRQQGQALQRRRGHRARGSRPLSLDDLPERARQGPSLSGRLAGRARRQRRLRAGSRRARPLRPGRCAQPAAVCGLEPVPGGRHSREGRSHEHGDLARDARAVPRRRPHGAGVLDAGSLEDQNGERKWILKQAMRGVLPESILNRRKEGFSIPMKNWLRRELQPLMRDLLSPDRVAKRGLFDPKAVTDLMDAHTAGRENHAHTLFPLMVFERWARNICS